MSGKAEDAGAENMQSENMRQDDMRQDDMRAENAGSESGAAAKLTCGVSVAGVNAACIGSNAKPAAENARAESNISAKNAAAESNAGAGEDAESAAGKAAEPDSVSGVSGRSPRLRFAGFAESWQTRKFGDVGAVSMCKRIFKEETSDEGEVPFYKIGTFGGDPDAYISRELYEKYKNKFPYPNKGDILLSASGTIGRIVEYNGEKAYFQDSNIVWLKHDESVCNEFLKVLYSIVKWYGIEGSTIKRLYNDNFLKTEFMVPSLEEQRLVGMFFSGLDRIISVQERKTELLRQAKKYFLQNMFPRRGESAPRLRVHGFTQPWQTMKFGDVFDWLKNNTLSRSELNYDGGVVRNVHYGDVLVKFGESVCVSEMVLPYITDVSKVERFGDSYLRDGDIVIADTAEDEMVGKCAEMQKCGDLKILSGLHTLPCRPKKEFGAGFLGCYLNSPSYRRQLRPLIQGIKVSSISKTSLKNTCMIVPPSLEEQRLVGRFFSGLDRIISVQERKTEALR
ncbi:MAG: restriction endonuclease subunit S, partial [Bifidobacteriaceae bacterium]|nr:restriction endonuclease subunit S [Bifidobacteriaceae bacterium]